MSVNTPLRELILINVGRVNGIMQTIVEDLGDLAAENERLRAQSASLEAKAEAWEEGYAEGYNFRASHGVEGAVANPYRDGGHVEE